MPNINKHYAVKEGTESYLGRAMVKTLSGGTSKQSSIIQKLKDILETI